VKFEKPVSVTKSGYILEIYEGKKEIEMNAIYQFELKNLELLDIGSTESADVEVE